MWEILIFFILGLVTGGIIKNRLKIQKAIGILTEWAVYLLLFFLGITVGLNKTIIENIGTIGFLGITISIIAVFFSILLAGFVYAWFYKRKQNAGIS